MFFSALSKTVGILLVYACSYTFVSAQDTTWLDNIASETIRLLEVLIPLCIGLAFLVFVWGLISLITNSADDTKRSEGRKKMVWGVLALVLLLSIWGILQLFQSMFSIANYSPAKQGAPSVSLP